MWLTLWAAAALASSAREQASSAVLDAGPQHASNNLRALLAHTELDGEAAIRSVGGYVDTPLSRAIAGNRSSVEGAEPRPFRFAAEVRNRKNKIDYPDVDETLVYLDRVLAALQSLLGHSVRVRRPSGNLDISGVRDLSGTSLDAFKANVTGADMAVIVDLVDPNWDPSGACGPGTIASALPWAFERGTRRPVVAMMWICELTGQLHFDLTVIAHEIFHALAFHSFAVTNFVGYGGSGRSPVGTTADGRTYIQTLQVRDFVQSHFACDDAAGALVEDGTGVSTIDTGTSGVGHWEVGLYFKDFMVGQASQSLHRSTGGRITDLSLAMLQDSGWYDVIYGTGGFSTHGYQAGCAFAIADRRGVLNDAAVASLLCPPGLDQRCLVDSCVGPLLTTPLSNPGPYEECLSRKPEECNLCLNDYSGAGMCSRNILDSGIVVPRPVADWALMQGAPNVESWEQLSLDCTDTLGHRCMQGVQGSASLMPKCHPMSCNNDRELLIDGQPCDASKYKCPDSKFMCVDPGVLLCLDELNDCNGHGDCFKGSCMCFVGWGGLDCSVPICEGQCDDGSPCPESGFCGVEVCGSWSKGAEDMGQRCTRARHSPIGPGAPSTDSSAPGSSAAQSGSTTSTPGFGTAGEVGSAAAGRWRLRASVVAATVASILGAVAL